MKPVSPVPVLTHRVRNTIVDAIANRKPHTRERFTPETAIARLTARVLSEKASP